ncbi:DUF6691 family protein [Candidatus Uabimicrobium amorphum]|uniref:Transporter n=1 Tax=Uabimicrobium amorphum TaxID=2596890 RepID=A0A5S9IT61_UABAM|nr:DUF6691 family protein [Candidatus Uabimicrobium amorphum]BBM87683.1 transporter [Candidatus Uabimicrobium amorphum]
MQKIVALFCGFFFASGLIISGMTNPHKVLSFLDIFGKWDPSLAFVMVGAIGVYSLSYRWIVSRTAPVCGDKFSIPSNKDLDKKLIIGAILFGCGWGLAGFCPGPAIVNITLLNKQVIVFFAAMVMGSLIFQFTNKLNA